MSTPDHKTDHAGIAGRLLKHHPDMEPGSAAVREVALVHSNLAIAEGLRDQNHWLEEIANQLSRAQS